MVKSSNKQWKMKSFESEDLVFCHNDLSTYNVIVDPVTLKVNAIIDWEYSGFYPEQFESKFFMRVGPSVALDGEVNDEEQLLDIMTEHEMK
jgi:aminoglycoside phosphotransferase